MNNLQSNILIHAENISALKYLLDVRNLTGQIDLVYIDPPFATGNNFYVSDNRSSTISNTRDEIAYSDKLLGESFISYLEERLIIIRELLSSNGSIYLHTDYKIGHYVKIMMDRVFGVQNFRNDITRIKCNPKNFNRIGYGNIKDMILFYTKTKNAIWNEPKDEYSQEDLVRLFPKVDTTGRRYTTVPIHAPGETRKGGSNLPFKGILPPKGRHWRVDVETLNLWDSTGQIEWSSNGNPRKIIYADEQKGKRVQDIWNFKDPQYTNYPTEKNLELLNQIIQTSSNLDSLVLDCFCGSGTTLLAAQQNGRRWIGVDQSQIAINATLKKINSNSQDLFKNNTYELINMI